MYGGEKKMIIFKNLYFNIVIKEEFLILEEFEFFCNYLF